MGELICQATRYLEIYHRAIHGARCAYVVLWREEQKEVSKECASLNKNLSEVTVLLSYVTFRKKNILQARAWQNTIAKTIQ